MKSRESRQDPYLDYGPNLPDHYGRPLVRLLARDPETLFAYWEGGGVLRIANLTNGTERFFTVADVGSRYAGAEPEHEYEAEIGCRSHDLFVAAAKSNRLRTPRRGPATAVDPEWSLTPAEEIERTRLSILCRPRASITVSGQWPVDRGPT